MAQDSLLRPSGPEVDFGFEHEGFRRYINLTARTSPLTFLELAEAMHDTNEPVVTMGAASALAELATRNVSVFTIKDCDVLLDKAEVLYAQASQQAEARLATDPVELRGRRLGVALQAQLSLQHIPATRAVAHRTPEETPRQLQETYDNLMNFSGEVLAKRAVTNEHWRKAAYKGIISETLTSAILNKARDPKLFCIASSLRLNHHPFKPARADLLAVNGNGTDRYFVPIQVKSSHRFSDKGYHQTVLVHTSPDFRLADAEDCVDTLKYLHNCHRGAPRHRGKQRQIMNMTQALRERVSTFSTSSAVQLGHAAVRDD